MTFLCVAAPGASAFGILAEWDLDGVPNAPVPTVEPAILAEGLESSGLLRGPGVGAGGLTNGFSANNFTRGPSNADYVEGDPIPSRAHAIETGQYIGFDILVLPGKIASLSSLDISLRRSALNGPLFYELQYSFDGFETPGTTIVDFTYRGRASGADQPQSTNPDDYMRFGAPDSYLDPFDLPPDLSGQSSAVSQPGNPMPTFDLTGFEELQDIPGGTRVTFALFAWGNQSTASSNTVGFGRINGPSLQGTIIDDPAAADDILLEIISEIEDTDPAPGFHLYSPGSQVTLTTTEEVEHDGSFYRAVGWTGTGSAPAQGEGNSVTFTITEPTTLEWHWLRIAGPIEPLLYYDVIASVDPTLEAADDPVGITPMVLSVGPGINPAGLANGFSSNGWDRITPGRDTALSNGDYFQLGFTVEDGYRASVSTIEASFRRSALNAPMYLEWQYSLDGFQTPGVTIPPTGPVWLEIGWEETYFNYFGRTSGTAPSDPVPLYAWLTEDVPGRPNATTSPGDPIPPIDLTRIPALQDVPAGTTVTFRLYAWGNTVTTATNTLAFGRMVGPAITGAVAPEGHTPLSIVSEVSGTDPVPGFRIHPVGTPVTVSAPEIVPVAEGTRNRLTGWTAAGSAPAEGTGSSTSFTLNEATTLTWHWDLEHLLQLATVGDGTVLASSSHGETPVSGSGSAWILADDTLTLEASPAAGHMFTRWSGGMVNSSPVVSFPMNWPFSATATFDASSAGDGIPDWWKLQYFGDVSVGAGDDPDGDGFDNRTEYLRGTNPTVADEPLALDTLIASPWENTQLDPILPGHWRIHDFGDGFRGALESSNNNRSAMVPFHPDGEPVDAIANISFDGPRMILRDEVWEENWKDGVYETILSVGDDDGNALYFRYQDELNWYRVVVSGEVNTATNRPLFGIGIQKRVDGQYHDLFLHDSSMGTDPEDISYYKRIKITVTADGSNFTVEVSGWDVFKWPEPGWDGPGDWGYSSISFTDFDLENGRAGFGTWAQGGAPAGTQHPDWNPVNVGALFESFTVEHDGGVVFEEDWSDAPDAEDLPDGWTNPFEETGNLNGLWRNSAHGTIAQMSAQGGSTSGSEAGFAADADGPILLAPEFEASTYLLDFGFHPFNNGAIGFVFDYIDSNNYGRVLFAREVAPFEGGIPDGVIISRKVDGTWTDVSIGDASFAPTLGRPFYATLSRIGTQYALTVQEAGRPDPLHRWTWQDGSAPPETGRHGFTTWQTTNAHFLFADVYGAMVDVADPDLRILGIERVGDNIVLTIDNPSGEPYDVQRKLDLSEDTWTTVDQNQTGATWTGPIPAGADRAFWILTR